MIRAFLIGMPDTRSDALADDALAFLKPLVVGVWGAVAIGILVLS